MSSNAALPNWKKATAAMGKMFRKSESYYGLAHREWIGIINDENAGLSQNLQTRYRATTKIKPKKKNNRSSNVLFC
jgi:hypothetical protein